MDFTWHIQVPHVRKPLAVAFVATMLVMVAAREIPVCDGRAPADTSSMLHTRVLVTKASAENVQANMSRTETRELAKKDISSAGFLLWCAIVVALVGTRPCCTQLMTSVSHPTQSKAMKLAEDDEQERMAGDGKIEPAVTAPEVDSRATLREVLMQGDPTSNRNSHPVVRGISTTHTWSLTQITKVMEDANWARLSAEACIVLAMPPGPKLAVALLCVLARTKCAPIDPDLTSGEAALAMRNLEATAALICPHCPRGVWEAAEELGLFIMSLSSASGMLTPFVVNPNRPVAKSSKVFSHWNTMADVAIVLCTSGTTGKPKVVPLRLGQLLQGAQCIVATMGLREDDVCLNVLPLFTIGGISCNLLGSLLSGGSVLCCEMRFNAQCFVDYLMHDPQPTWYYAVPTVHLALTELANLRGSTVEHSIRLCRSAGAALLPTLEQRLAKLWGCPILNAYGMTECIPIASPLVREHCVQGAGASLAPLGSVGRAVGVVVEVHDGQVMLRGNLVTQGYVGSESGWLHDKGLFPTGDLGYVDTEGFLWITGRSKEGIKCGGENIAPRDVEKMLAKHTYLHAIAAFGVPHQRLGEALGLAIVLQDGIDSEKVFPLIVAKVSESLSQSHQPALMVIMDHLPRTSTGKVQRMAIHQELIRGGGPEELTGAEPRCMIVDVRGGKRKYLTPEQGTVRDVFHQKEREATDEVVNSLGVVSTHSHRQALEQQAIRQVYFLHVVAIVFLNFELPHDELCDRMAILAYECSPLVRLHPYVQQAVRLFHTGNLVWHMPAIFALCAYQDSSRSKNHLLNGRDVLMAFATVALHWMSIYPPTQAFVEPHPARWFFSIILLSRLFINIGHKLRLPALFQTMLAYPCAVLWIVWRTWATVSLVGKMGNLGSTVAMLLMVYDPGVAESQAMHITCFTAYVFSFFWLPQLVELLAQQGPATLKRQRIWGMIFWASFMCWSWADLALLSNFRSWVWLFGCWQKQDTCVHIPVLWRFPLMLGRLLLAGAAITFLPMSVIPDVAYHSLLGSLLAMPLTTSPWVRQFFLSPYMTQSASSQLLAILVFLTVYFVVVSPVVQWVCLCPFRLVQAIRGSSQQAGLLRADA